ncbi:MAG TPA: galactokinase [Acidimicrobiales bacterium]|nr:galactokinase [Acidimicrobiales bacterium]
MSELRARAPGRVNLIGDHTDYTGGLVLPMAIDLSTVVTGTRGGDQVVLSSDHEDAPVVIALDISDPAQVEPAWGRYAAGVIAQMRPSVGLRGHVSSDVPVGAGLSSSAALEVALALALGFEGTPLDLATLCQRAEQRATGVPCGIMDQLASAAGVAGHALRIDCTTLQVTPVPLPADVEVVVVHSGQARRLAGSEYATRRSQCEAAEAVIGPLRQATPSDAEGLRDPVLRKRARHVVTENARVDLFVAALSAGRADDAGQLMLASHASLRADFEVSTDVLDSLVDDLRKTPGVFGARLTGAGFGGCVVALAEPGAIRRGWVVKASPAASVQ